MNTRKNQKDFSQDEWNDLIDAINQTHGVSAAIPAYRDFVKVHVRAMDMHDPDGMSWGVHTMGPNMQGRNFLAWHRQLVWQFEQRLRKIRASITIPYWDALTDRAIPKALNDPKLLKQWSVKRKWNAAELAPKGSEADLYKIRIFTTFQPAIEGGIHNAVHRAVGGDMVTSASPSDPIFWLHHADIDRIWATWQKNFPKQSPPNKDETLKPTPLFGIKVSDVLDIDALGYTYA